MEIEKNYHERKKLKPTSIKVSDTIINKAKELVLKFPDDYSSIGQVFRSGVIKLYEWRVEKKETEVKNCLLYTSPSPRDRS